MGGSIVLVEYDDAGVGEGFFEFEDVANVGASKRVHGLVAVADYEHVLVFVAELQDNVVLCRVGVLVFVDEDMLEAFLIVAEGVGVGGEQFDGDVE